MGKKFKRKLKKMKANRKYRNKFMEGYFRVNYPILYRRWVLDGERR